jgi:hypothetical protein
MVSATARARNRVMSMVRASVKAIVRVSVTLIFIVIVRLG